MGKIRNLLGSYQPIPRELVFDNSISDRARFVYIYMASKPEDWDFYLSPMAKEIGYSVDTLRKYIQELVQNGWLTKGEQANEGSFGAVEYTINPTKKPCTEISDTQKTPHKIKEKEYKREIKEEKTKKDELFEECWIIARRHGVKQKALAYWNKLSEQDKQLVKAHIAPYVKAHPDVHYQKHFDGYLKNRLFENVVYNGNAVIFDPERIANTDEYRPMLDGHNMFWHEGEKVYISYYDIDMLADGYTKDNRPSSAKVRCGMYTYYWNAETKTWEKEQWK